MSDLVERLRAKVTRNITMEAAHTKTLEWEAADRIAKLDAALRAICEGDIPRPVAKPYRADGTPSKNDQCEHGQWMYEECGQCIEQFARAALTAQEKRNGE